MVTTIEAVRTTKFIEENDVKLLLSLIDSVRDRAIFTLAYYHGLRASEVAMLTEKDYDATTPQLYVHRLKNGRSRWHRLSEQENQVLAKWMKVRGIHGPDVPLFISRRSSGIGRRSLDYLMKQYGKLANLPEDKCHFHVLRHSCATAMVRADISIVKIRDWLGHVDIKNTMIYADVSDASMEDTGREWEKHNKEKGIKLVKGKGRDGTRDGAAASGTNNKIGAINWGKDKIKLKIKVKTEKGAKKT